MGSYASDAKRIFAANVVSAVAGLGVQTCLAWMLLPEGRGQYAACILFASLLALGCALGQEMANVYFVGSKRIDVSQAMTLSIVVGVATSVVACSVGYLLTLTSLSIMDKAPVEMFRLSLLCIPAMIFYSYLSRIFLGASAFGTFTLLTALPRVIGLAGLLAASAIRLDVRTAILIYACSEGLVAVTALFLLIRRDAARLVRFDIAQLRSSLSYGVRFYFGKLASMANVQMGTIILAMSSVAVAELGLFAAASVLASRLWIVAETLQTAMLPRAAADPEGKSQAVAQCVRLCLVCSAAAALVVLVLAKPIIAVILSPRFLPVVVPFQVLLPGIVIRVIPKILPAYFNGIGRPGVTSTAIAVAVGANVLLMCLLLPIWGLVGVALAMTLSYALEALIMGAAFLRLSGLPVGRLVLLDRSDVDALRGVGRRFMSRHRQQREKAPS